MNDSHTIHLNHQQRRYLDRLKKRKQKQSSGHVSRGNATANKKGNSRVELTDHIVYHDDSYKDKHKISGGRAMDYLRQRIADKKRKYNLPEKVNSLRKPLLTSCLLINRDGKPHQFLPDRPPHHCLLVHRNVAKALVSGVCMFVRITSNTDADGNIIDGSWAIVPAEYRMMQATTIQTLRKRPFWFLRRYHYEISFDGRVQPAHLLFDYGLNPLARRQRLYITSEYVQIKKTNRYNSFFRFWLHRPAKSGTDAVKPQQ